MSREQAARLNTLWGRLVVEELGRCGVEFVCVSPGSRSTPLTAAVAADRTLETALWLDERGAAFHALGHARAHGRPVALVCTSGTAVANYLPAVVEAAQDCVPLVLLTADRPPELLDAGANQAIVQPGIFGGYVRWSASLPAPDAAVPLRAVLSTVDQAVHRAQGPPAGPVHVNCMFREPLEPAGEGPWPEELPARWREGVDPLTAWSRPTLEPDAAAIARATAAIEGARRGLVVVGRLPFECDRQAALRLCDRLGWPVATDIRSELRLGPGPAGRVAHLDQLLLSARVRESFAPDVVLHLGAQPVSKRLSQALGALGASTLVAVQDHPFRHDPDHGAAQRVQADVSRFCAALVERLPDGPGAAGAWGARLRRLSDRAAAAIDAFLAGGALTEIAAARIVSREIPASHALFLGNSMPVRDMEMFADTAGPRVPVGANRGASGIDGVVSAAAGFAGGHHSPATLVIGDLSLLHDLNALAHLRALDHPLVIVVLNNGGGGIFHFLPIAGHPGLLEPWFTAPQTVDFAALERLFGIPCSRPGDAAEFTAAYRAACASGAPALIEVRSDGAANLAAHRALGEAVVAAAEAER